MALINQHRVWSTIFITQKDRRSFVEACLERSHPVPLDVTMDARRLGRILPDCACDKRRRGKLFPNESNPCEWHFQFESLAGTKHSDRIRALDIDFGGMWWGPAEERAEKIRLGLGSCRFFTSSFPRLITLSWRNDRTKHANHLFSISPFTPTLRSLTYEGPWDCLLVPVSNLTSFVFESDMGPGNIYLEDVRLFLLNNRSLESLGLEYVYFEGDSAGPSVLLSNLRSLNIGLGDNRLSTIIRVPALQHLASLRLESDAEHYTLYATGDGIGFSIKRYPDDVVKGWEEFTGYTKPKIRHIHLDNSGPVGDYDSEDITFVSMLLDAHTLEIGSGYFPFWYDGFLDDLKQLPQLKTIRFAIPEGLEAFPGDDDDDISLWDYELLDTIGDLVQYRFYQGRSLSTVERMVTSECGRTDREQDFVWRCFYGDRELSKYVQSG